MATPTIKATYSLDAETVRMLERLAKRRQRVPVNIFAVAWAEFVCGPVPPSAIEDAAELLGEPVPLGGIEASVAARLFNEGGRRRGDFERFTILGLSLA